MCSEFVIYYYFISLYRYNYILSVSRSKMLTPLRLTLQRCRCVFLMFFAISTTVKRLYTEKYTSMGASLISKYTIWYFDPGPLFEKTHPVESAVMSAMHVHPIRLIVGCSLEFQSHDTYVSILIII